MKRFCSIFQSAVATTSPVNNSFAKATACHRRMIVENTSGQALVETALSMSIAITISFAVFEFCLMMYTYCAFNEAVREGVRYAIVHGTTSTSCSGPSSGCADSGAANVIAVVTGAATLGFEPILANDVHVTYLGGSSAPNSAVTISITKTYVPLVAFLGIAPTFTVSSQGRIIY